MAERPVATGGKRNGNVLQEAFTVGGSAVSVQLASFDRGSFWQGRLLLPPSCPPPPGLPAEG
jgi:hypothetical protein